MRERVVIFFTLLFAYAYFFGGSGFNQNATFDLTRAIVERHALSIDPYASNTADVSFHAGHVYSNKAPGLAFAAAIPYALLQAIHGAPRNAIELNLYLYFCTVIVCGVIQLSVVNTSTIARCFTSVGTPFRTMWR